MQKLRHPAADCTSSRNVNPPAVEPTLTDTEAPVVEPTIEAPEVLLVNDQLWVAMFDPDDEYIKPVAPAQLEVGPEIEQLGLGLTVTPMVQKLVHPADEVTSSLSVYEPAPPALTVTEDPVVPPTNDAPEVLLANDQLWDAILVPEDEYARLVAPAHGDVGPVIEQLGVGLTVTVAELEQVNCVPPLLVPVTLILLVMPLVRLLTVSVQVLVAWGARVNVVLAGK